MNLTHKELKKLFGEKYIKYDDIVLVKTKKGNFIRLTNDNIDKVVDMI